MTLAIPALHRLPLTPGELEAYRLRIKRSAQVATLGGHLSRRQGQSLEFRDFAPYTPGDDVRYVDWRASARYRDEDDLLVRRFQAEDQFTVVISIDGRQTLWLPNELPKRQVAFWLAEALAWVALGANDRVYLHDLFGSSSEGLQSLRGKAQRPRLPAALANLAQGGENADEQPNLYILERVLKPAVVWIIITDLYFPQGSPLGQLSETAEALARAIIRARTGLRWVIVVDLDSWEHERAALDEGGLYIDGPGQVTQDRPYQITATTVQQVQDAIHAYKQNFWARSHLPHDDLSHWEWPVDLASFAQGAAFFRQRFGDDAVLARIFERSS